VASLLGAAARAEVKGALAEHFNVDATLIRVLFVVLAVLEGSGILLTWPCGSSSPVSPRERRSTIVADVGRQGTSTRIGFMPTAVVLVPRLAIGGRVLGWLLGEGASAPQRAETVLHALVGEPAHPMAWVDRHAAHRINRQP
jgi:PspC domain